MARVLAISDLQAPFQHRDALDFLAGVREDWKCDRIVCVGDEIDFHALSDFTHDPDGYSPGRELEAALDFMHELYKVFPDVSVCISNHTSRPYRRAFKAGIPSAFMRDYKEFMEAPEGWNWRDHWEIDGVRYEHGHALRGGVTITSRYPLANGQSTVFGHHHARPGILWVDNPQGSMFGFNVGCLIDKTAYAFKYWTTPTVAGLGGGVIIDGKYPHFIPLIEKKRGRWNGDTAL